MKRAAASVSRFIYLELENWRNFIRVQTAWQRRVFLLGANASGKSNFLDVFRFLRDIVAVGGRFPSRCCQARGRCEAALPIFPAVPRVAGACARRH